jgi:hypothetical protein
MLVSAVPNASCLKVSAELVRKFRVTGLASALGAISGQKS